MASMTITAAADGSALGNPGPAGWAWYIDENTWRAGGWPHGTNNMGELKAVLDLLEATAVDADQHLHVLCDSQYVINSVTKWMPGWKRKGWRKKDGKPVLNVELLKDIDRALQGRSVEFEWVKGHSGHALNEAADRRANAAATALSRQQDPDIGPGYRADGDARTAVLPSDAPATAVAAASPTGPATVAAAAGPTTGAVSPVADDLFSLFDEPDPGDVPGPPDRCGAPEGVYPADHPEATDLEAVIAHEQALLSDRLRADPPSAAALLHPEFTETGASGRDLSREEVLEELAPLRGADGDRIETAELVAAEIAPGVVLLRYETDGEAGGVPGEARGTVRRSSLWLREGDRWLLRHHQGTVVTDQP